LKIWVLLFKPKIEDGNNFGVAIQEHTLALIQAVHGEVTECHEKIYNYYVSRAKIVSKVCLILKQIIITLIFKFI